MNSWSSTAPMAMRKTPSQFGTDRCSPIDKLSVVLVALFGVVFLIRYRHAQAPGIGRGSSPCVTE
jgi:hypothetical protein